MSVKFYIKENVLVRYSGKDDVIVIPEGVTEIAANAFREGTIKDRGYIQAKYRKVGTVKSVVFPSSLQKIGENAFDGCKSLNILNLSENITIIEKEAFRGCSSLEYIYIPSGVEEIGEKAFWNCENIKKVEIGDGLRSIGTKAFGLSSMLTEYLVSDGNSEFASEDGMLLSKDRTTLIHYPAGKNTEEFTVPDYMTCLGDYAFFDSFELKKIVIPAHVSKLGDYVFPRRWALRVHNLQTMEVDPKAGSVSVGKEVFDLEPWYEEYPLTNPTLPVTFVKERKIQYLLALGYCEHPELYQEKYAENYENYIDSHLDAVFKKAQSLDRDPDCNVEKCLSFLNAKKHERMELQGYAPDLKRKKPSEQAKVAILEEAVLRGSLKDVTDVLETYKTFELTARSLGLAARFRGVDFVKVLVEHGATFHYELTTEMKRKYQVFKSTPHATYKTDYELLIIPGKIQKDYIYSPLIGIADMYIDPEQKLLSIEERMESIKYLAKHPEAGASIEEMLYYALVLGELELADAMIQMGISLNNDRPKYYTFYRAVVDKYTYMDIVTQAEKSFYMDDYLRCMKKLSAKKLYEVLKRLYQLAEQEKKTLMITKAMLDGWKWSKKSTDFVLQYCTIEEKSKK